MDDIRPLREMAKNKQIVNQKLELFTPSTAYQAAYQQPTGSRFGADGMYHGENRSSGAQLSYYVKIDEKKADDKENDKKEKDDESDKDNEESEVEDNNVVKWDSLTMNIYDGERLIRTLKQKAPDSSGVYKWTWYMYESGSDNPSRTIKSRKSEPRGPKVKPGTYKVVMSFGDQTSEEMIKVESDPRLNVSQSNITEVYNASKELENMQQVAADAVKQLVESKQIAESYQSDLKKLDKKTYKEQIKASKDLEKKIDEIIDIYLGKEDKRQGIVRNRENTIVTRFSDAASYVQSRQNGLTSTERTLMQHAKNELDAAIEKTNAFFNDDWKTYQTAMESLKATPFKPIKTFKL
jgi:hypothetical protein